MNNTVVDIKGNAIDQRSKDGHSVEVRSRGLFTGRRFLLKTRLYGDKRCLYCGKWYHWKDTDSLTWLRMNNVDTMNKDGALEPLHCGSEHCQEFHRRYLIAEEKRHQMSEEKKDQYFFSLYKNLKKRGIL